MATELLIQMYKTEVNYKKYYAYDKSSEIKTILIISANASIKGFIF